MDPPNAVDDKQQNNRQRLSGTNDHSDGNGQVPIRTVYIGGIAPFMINNVKSYFGQFGEVESVAMQSEDKQTRWCLVQFKRAKDAEEALLRTGNKSNDCDLKAADPWHQPDHPLQVAPAQDSDSNISVALNDDCLQAIFERLKPSSLTNVAGVCVRFNEQAKKTFALNHKHLDLTKQFHWYQSDLIETATKHFGKDIQSLIVDAGLFSREADAIRMIGQNCGPKLKQLELRNFRFQTDLRPLRSIFAQIEQMKLDRCAMSFELGDLMARCGELKSLRLSFCDSGDDPYILSRTFPKLQEFSLSCNQLVDENLEGFIIRHPTLIKLSIENAELALRLLSTIGQHARNLQELRIFKRYDIFSRDDQNNAAYIGQLSSLKKLQLNIDDSIVSLLNALVADEVPIESLKIQFNRQLNIDRAIKSISQLKRIKILQLRTHIDTRRVTDKDVVQLAECLPELEELHLGEYHGNERFHPNYSFKPQLSSIGLRKMVMLASKLKLLKLRSIESIKIDLDDYKAMLRTVQERKEKVPLVIEIHGKADQIDVPAPVLAASRNTLNIKLIR